MAPLPAVALVAPDRSSPNADQGYRLGAQALDQGRLEAAAAAFWSCLAIDPRHAGALHLLGKVRERQGQLEAALTLQLGSWRSEPSLGWNAFAAAELLGRCARWGEAAAAYRAALEALPGESWIAAKAREQEGLGVFAGERLAQGFSAAAYRIWCRAFEPPLLSPSQPLASERLASTAAWCVDRAPDAVLRPGALECLADWLADHPEGADLIYPDEDRLDASGVRHDPWFKPGWVVESFWSTPWLGACAFWRRDWLRDQGLTPPPAAADPLARWRWQLAALERGPRVAQLARVLVHRSDLGSVSPAPTATPSASTLTSARAAWLSAPFAEALVSHLHRIGEGNVRVEARPQAPGGGGFRLHWPVPRALRLSVIVLTRDRPDLLARCLHSVELSRGGALDLEWLLVDNGSRLEATAALLRHWRQRPGCLFSVLPLDQPFNWSLLNNRAVEQVTGELLLFLNNDVAVPDGAGRGWLLAMAGQARRFAIGCVGARLLYPDRRLQHAGLLPPLGAGCEHPYRGMAEEHPVHRGRMHQLTGWPAVTGACLMVRRALWHRAGGFDAALPVEGNDVDFALRLGRMGYRHVVCPEATLLHHEAASRNASNSVTWGAAQSLLMRRWPGAMASGSPWWPAAASLETTDGRPRELGGRGWS